MHSQRKLGRLTPRDATMSCWRRNAFSTQLAPRTGQIGDDAAGDGRRPVRIAEKTHCRGCQAGNGCCNPEAENAKHHAIRANPKKDVKRGAVKVTVTTTPLDRSEPAVVPAAPSGLPPNADGASPCASSDRCSYRRRRLR